MQMGLKMFCIDKNSEIFFYGYPQFDFVKEKYFYMLSDGYKVMGFIDRRAQELKKEANCFSIEEFIKNNKNNENIVVIFLLQNGSRHEEIARRLLAEGYTKILFLPFNIDTKEKKKMYEKYNLFLEGDYGSLNEIPETDKVLLFPTQPRQQARNGKKWDIYFVPEELLFSYNPGGPHDNENIRFCAPYVELYDYLTGKCEKCDSYLTFMKKNKKEEFLEDRRRMFFNYERERNFGMEYFIETAAYVKWNEKGYFNIIDGHHRAVYLAYMGYRQIPVRIKKQDFIKWGKQDETMKTDNVRNFPCPVCVPPYLNEKEFFEPRWQNVIDFFYKELVLQKRTGLEFVESDLNLGYYARYFDRAGWFQCTIKLQDGEDALEYEYLNHILCRNIEIGAVYEKKAQTAYLDIDVCEETWVNHLLSHKDFICLVFEVKNDNAEKIIENVERRMNSSVRLLCSYQDSKAKKIYGITRRYT